MNDTIRRDSVEIELSIDKWRFVIVESRPEPGEKSKKWAELSIEREHDRSSCVTIMNGVFFSREDLQVLRQTIELLLLKL